MPSAIMRIEKMEKFVDRFVITIIIVAIFGLIAIFQALAVAFELNTIASGIAYYRAAGVLLNEQEITKSVQRHLQWFPYVSNIHVSYDDHQPNPENFFELDININDHEGFGRSYVTVTTRYGWFEAKQSYPNST